MHSPLSMSPPPLGASHSSSVVHLHAPRPLRFASFPATFHLPVPVALPPPAAQSVPVQHQQSTTFDAPFTTDQLREAFATLGLGRGVGGSAQQDVVAVEPLTPDPASPPDYLLEILSIMQPRAPFPNIPAPITATLAAELTAPPSPPYKPPTPPPRPAAPFRASSTRPRSPGFVRNHGRHLSATDVMLAGSGRRERGPQAPYWVPSPERRRRGAGSVSRQSSLGGSRRTTPPSAGSTPSPTSPHSHDRHPTFPPHSFPLPFPAPFLLSSSTPLDTPYPVSVEVPAASTPLGLGMDGFRFPAPLQPEAAYVDLAFEEEQEGDGYRPAAAAAEVGESPRALLLREMQEDDGLGMDTGADDAEDEHEHGEARS